MAIDPNLLTRLSQPMVNIYNDLEIQLIQAVSRLLSRDPQLLTSESIMQWQIEKLALMGSLTRETARIISNNTGISDDMIWELFQTLGLDAIEEEEHLLLEAYGQGLLALDEPPVFAAQDSIILQILESYQSQARNIFNLTNATLLSQTSQFYRDVIARTTADVLAGIETPRQALRSSLAQWSERGIPALVDRSGRRWGAQEYVTMVIRTTANNVVNEMQDARFDAWGVDLIEISSHLGARPLCAPYQGRIFSRSGQSGRYPAFSTTSYGHPAGLFGVNCGHRQYSYIPGFSRKTYQPYPKRRNDEIYEQSQKQRSLERSIRRAKRRLGAMEAWGDETGINRAKTLLKRRQKAMRDFIDETGRTRRRDREQVV